MQVQTPPNVISSDLLVSVEEVLSDLRILPTQKAHRRLSDQMEFQIVKGICTRAQDIFNQSLRELKGLYLTPLKSSQLLRESLKFAHSLPKILNQT